MTQVEIKELATQIVGDSQEPNQFFVTESPCILVFDEFGECEYELLDGYEDKDSYMFGPFKTFEEAEDAYNESELDIYSGVGSVTIEDRMTGQIKEKCLEKVVRVDYSYRENDDSKLFGYKK